MGQYDVTFPALGQQSWHAAFVATVNSIAAMTISATAQPGAHAQLVLSATTATSQWFVYDSAGLQLGTTSRWETLSSGTKGGVWVASFQIVGTSRAAFLEISGELSVGAGSGMAVPRLAACRGIITPGSIALGAYVGTNQALWWMAAADYHHRPQDVQLEAVDVLPLAPGNYQLRLEVRPYAQSWAYLNPNHLWTVHLSEVAVA